MNKLWKARFPRPLLSAVLLMAGLFLGSGVSLRAQELALDLDPAQTKIEFTLGATMHTVHGTFHLKRGALRLDPASGAISGEVIVDAKSGQTANDGRDKKMHRQVLESERYSEIIFRPSHLEGKVAPSGASSVQVRGVFAIHGAEHEITVPVTANLADGHYTATVKFSVPFIQWGLKNPSNFFLHVSDTVEVSLQLAGRVSMPTSKSTN